jgi:hypothetical protein
MTSHSFQLNPLWNGTAYTATKVRLDKAVALFSFNVRKRSGKKELLSATVAAMWFCGPFELVYANTNEDT